MKFLLLGLLLSLPARADIVFFDLNFSPKEITAVTAAAKARGEAVRVFPERSPELQRGLDKYYRLVNALQGKLRGCKDVKNCDALRNQLNEAFERLQALTGQVRKVEGAELERIFSVLDAEGVHVSTMIFSGHSGGTGQVGGILGGIQVQQVRQAFDRFPRLLEPVNTMLLWGCYSGTLHSLNGIWQKNFPTVTTWGGFENRSPLGIRESSGRFLKSFLLTEGKLRAARGLKEAHRVFRSLDLVADLDGTAVVRDMYFTYDEADLISEMLKRCESFDAGMMDAFTCYEEGKAGCENPPADHRGPLREFYNYLQKNRHCRGGLQEKFPNLPSVEYLIRLIYLDNVKKNFAAHHSGESESFGRVMRELPSVPALGEFGTNSRAQDVAAFHVMQAGLNEKGSRDLSVVDNPNWRSVFLAATAKETLTNILGPSFYRNSEFSCVPFSWVDAGAREKDGCMLSEALEYPVSPSTELQLTAMLAHTYIDKYLNDHVISSFWIPITEDKDAWKEQIRERVRLSIRYLEQLTDRSPLEESRLSANREKCSRLGEMTVREVAASEVLGLRGLLSLVNEKIEWAKGQPYGGAAKSILENRKQVIQRAIADLDQLAQD